MTRSNAASPKRVSMHVFRHTAAMTLLNAGIDTATIALWLGHEQERTTHVYFHADLARKQRTLDIASPHRPADPAATARPTRYSRSSRASDPTALGQARAAAAMLAEAKPAATGTARAEPSWRQGIRCLRARPDPAESESLRLAGEKRPIGRRQPRHDRPLRSN